MNQTEKKYINLISGCINNVNEMDIDFENVQLSELVNLCVLHSNVSVIYRSLKRTKAVPKPFLDMFEQGFHIEMLKYSKKMTVLNILLDELNKHKIKHIIFKGITIARLYPEEELRTMGDLDFLIDENDMEKVHKIMKTLNAEYDYEGSDEFSKVYKLELVNVEFHSKIANGETLLGRYDYETYFRNVFEYTEHAKLQSYILQPEYNMIYVLFHAAKHFTHHGCGVRMITDIAVMTNAYREKLNWKWLWEQLESIRLKQYAVKIFSLCNYWFGTEVPGIDYNFEKIELLENQVMSGGVFGYKNVDADTGRIRKKNGSNYFISILKWAFPSYKEMKEHSQWFKDKPAVLLPIAYVERFVRNAKERNGVINWGKAIYKGKSKSDRQDEILKILELK